MQQQQNPSLVKKILWVSFLVSLIIYGYLFKLVPAILAGPPKTLLMTLPEVGGDLLFYVLGFASFAGSFFVPRMIPKQANQDEHQHDLVKFLIRIVMVESVAVLGLVAAIFAANASVYNPFAALAFIGIALAYPRDQ